MTDSSRRDEAFTVTPLAGALGARVDGIDLAAPMDDETFAAIEQAWYEHLVLLFPNQDLTPAQHVAFSKRFGPLLEHPLKSRRGLDDFPEVLVLENRPGRPGARNDFWHSDVSFAAIPPMGSLLYARKVPPGGKGDTMFCNMYRAWDGLSEGLRAVLDGRMAVHDGSPLARRNAERTSDGQPITQLPDPVEHPIARTHPGSGRKALFVNPYFTQHIAGLTAEESRPLLDPVYALATRPENTFRHRWSVGDLLLWDNRCAMHYAILDYDDTVPRLMHRTTVTGEQPN